MSTEKVDPSRGAGKTTAFMEHLQQENAKLRARVTDLAGLVDAAKARITELGEANEQFAIKERDWIGERGSLKHKLGAALLRVQELEHLVTDI